MTVPPSLERAVLVEYDDTFQSPRAGGKSVDVQFNPETLKVSFANQVQQPRSAGDQRGPSTQQFVGAGTTKLSLGLWFDVSAPPHTSVRDVRDLTRQVAYFITPVPGRGQGGGGAGGSQTDTIFRPPPTGFGWGTFLFVGIMDSLEESLELWSDDGRPLRANLTLAISKQSIAGTLQGRPRGGTSVAGGGSPGTRPLTPATSGASVQGMTDAAGTGARWQSIAAANSIENPRRLAPGQLLDMSAGASGGVGVRR